MNSRIAAITALLSAVCVVSSAQTRLLRGLVVQKDKAQPVVVIPSREITQSPPAVKGARAVMGQLGGSSPLAPNMGLQAPPKGKLDITLTPANPASLNRAYLKYDYPRSVYISTGTAYAEYSKENIPGFFGYTVRLEKAKKYLLEITVTVEPKNKALSHSIGGQQSVHTLSGGVQTITATVEPEATGWVSGTLHQSNTNTPTSWRVFSVSIKEL